MRSTGTKCYWRIGEILIQKDWINWDQLEKALAKQRIQRRLIGEILVDSGVITRQQVLRALAFQHGIDFVNIKDRDVEQDALHAVPKRYAFEHHVLPLEKSSDSLVVATSNPNNYWAKALLSQTTGIADIRNVLACPEDIDDALIRYYGENGQVA